MKICAFSSLTLALALMLATVGASVCTAQGADGKRIDHLKHALERADSLHAEKKLMEARNAYLRILFVKPSHGRAKKRVRDINMEGPLPGRLMMYDFISTGKRKREKNPSATVNIADLEEILEAYGMTVKQHEQAFLDYHRNN